MDPAAQAYIDDIDPENRPLCDRIRGLITEEFPDVEIGVAYKMPVFRREGRSLNVGAWKHGVSIYGWDDRDAGAFLERHPEMSSGKGTLRIPRKAADDVLDAELTEIIRGSLGSESADPQS